MGEEKRELRFRGVKRIGMLSESFEHKQICKVRRELGFGPIIVKRRECLRCDREFESEGVQHRLCHNCKYTSDAYAPDREVMVPSNI